MEHRRHQPLECGGGITVPLLHHSIHEGAEYGGECGFQYILWSNAYLFIHLRHVQFGPVGSMSDVMPDRVLIRKGQYILFHIGNGMGNPWVILGQPIPNLPWVSTPGVRVVG